MNMILSRQFIWIQVMFCFMLFVGWSRCQYSIKRQDPFGLLFGTLQTYHSAACDSEELNLVCFEGTTISIQFVQYGTSKVSSEVSILLHWSFENFYWVSSKLLCDLVRILLKFTSERKITMKIQNSVPHWSFQWKVQQILSSASILPRTLNPSHKNLAILLSKTPKFEILGYQ